MMEVDISTYIPNGEWDLVGKKQRHTECFEYHIDTLGVGKAQGDRPVM